MSEYVAGTKGRADVSGSRIFDASGKVIHDFGNLGGDGHQQEHHDLFADLRAGKIAEEGEWGALSTMTAIFGRMATYSGEMLNWDECLNSPIELAKYAEFTDFSQPAPVQASGRRHVFDPGPRQDRRHAGQAAMKAKKNA